jgi:hypothetical protein
MALFNSRRQNSSGEEQARVERLVRLETVWTRNVRLRELVARVREAIGEVEAQSELDHWLAWQQITPSAPIR